MNSRGHFLDTNSTSNKYNSTKSIDTPYSHKSSTPSSSSSSSSSFARRSRAHNNPNNNNTPSSNSYYNSNQESSELRILLASYFVRGVMLPILLYGMIKMVY